MLRVNIATGEVCESATDFELLGVMPLEFERTHVSFGAHVAGALGFGWAHPFAMAFRLDAKGYTYLDGNGGEIPFGSLETGRTVESSEHGLRLSMDSGALAMSSVTRTFIFTPHSNKKGLFLLRQVRDPHENTIQLQYDQSGQLQEITDSDARRLFIETDRLGRIAQISLLIDPRTVETQRLVSYRYDEIGDLVGVIDALGNECRYQYADHLIVAANYGVTAVYATYNQQKRCIGMWRGRGAGFRQYSYDAKTRSVTEMNSLGAVSVYRTNEAGIVIEEIDALGGVYRKVLGESNRILATINPAGEPQDTWAREADSGALYYIEPTGCVTIITPNQREGGFAISDVAGNMWIHVVDSQGLQRKQVSPTGATTSFDYDKRGRLSRIVTPNGRTIDRTWSADSRTLTIKDDFGPIATKRYDIFGQLIEIIDTSGSAYTYTYDLLGRIIRAKNFEGEVTEYRWNQEGALLESRFGSRAPEQYQYDDEGRCVSCIKETGERLTFELDTEDRLTKLTNQKGEAWRFEYDPLGRPIKQVYPDGRVETYRYDLAGRLIEVGEQSGTKTRFDYAPGGLLQGARDSNGNETSFDYDANDALIKASYNDVTITYEYDQEGRLAKEDQEGLALEYTYDIESNCTGYSTSDGRSYRYEYDKRNRLTLISDEDGGEFKFEYDWMDNPVACVLPNSVRETSRFDAQGRLTKRSYLSPAGGIILEHRYSYDDSGHLITDESSSGQIITYGYDHHGRLLRVTRNGEVTETYSYDFSENLIASSEFSVINYGAGNRVLSAGPLQFEYDQDGRINEINNKGQRIGLEYGPDGMLLRSANSENRITHYTYDFSSRRLMKSTGDNTTRYLWSRGSIVSEYREWSGSQDRINYLHHPHEYRALAIHSARGVFFPIADPRGAITELLDASGQVTWRGQYSAWGNLFEQSPSDSYVPFRLAGQVFDEETGLHYNRFRYYLPQIGRYLSPDPLGLTAGTNLYSYPLDPIMIMDPLGLVMCGITCQEVRNLANYDKDYTKYKEGNKDKIAAQQDNASEKRNNVPKAREQCPAKKLHEECINHVNEAMSAVGAGDIRADQAMVRADGNRGGKLRPDSQATLSGVRFYTEVDNPPYIRMRGHIARICRQDPDAMIGLVALPDDPQKRKSKNMDEKCGTDQEVDFKTFEKDFIKPDRTSTY